MVEHMRDTAAPQLVGIDMQDSLLAILAHQLTFYRAETEGKPVVANLLGMY